MIYISPKREVTVGGLDRVKYLEVFREYERRQQSRKDSEQSWQISHNHKRYPCENHTQCRVCSHIKHLLRSVKHNANPDHKNRKCPVCYWKREIKCGRDLYSNIHGGYENMAKLYEENNKVLIKYLYFGLLNDDKRRGRVPHCSRARWSGQMYIT